MTNYVTAFVTLVPNALISYTGEDLDYDEIEWLDERPQPTKAECDAAWPQIDYDQKVRQAKWQRQHRYQRETDGMFFDAMRTGAELTEWIAAVEAIKAELPYPEAPAV